MKRLPPYHRCAECRHFPDGTTSHICPVVDKRVVSTTVACLDGRSRDAMPRKVTTMDEPKIAYRCAVGDCAHTADTLSGINIHMGRMHPELTIEDRRLLSDNAASNHRRAVQAAMHAAEAFGGEVEPEEADEPECETRTDTDCANDPHDDCPVGYAAPSLHVVPDDPATPAERAELEAIALIDPVEHLAVLEALKATTRELVDERRHIIVWSAQQLASGHSVNIAGLFGQFDASGNAKNVDALMSWVDSYANASARLALIEADEPAEVAS